MNLRRPPFIATLFTALGILILCGLGTWQLQRLAWKQNILAQIDAEYASKPKTLNTAELIQDFEFKRGTVKGKYDYNKQILLGPRVHDGKVGNHVLTPLILDNGTTVIVDRGWAPPDYKETSTGRQNAKATGLLRRPDPRNAFTPQNAPEKNQWYYPDTDEIAATLRLEKTLPHILYLETDAHSTNLYPVTETVRLSPANNHKQYAIFWFTMAGVLAIVFCLRFLNRVN